VTGPTNLRVLVAVMAAGVSLIQEVTFAPRFIVGDTLALEVTQSVQDTTWPEADFSVAQTTHVHVSAVTNDGVALDWQPGDVKSGTGTPLGPNLKMVLAVKATAGLLFKVRLDTNGRYQSVTSPPEQDAQISAVRDRAVDALRKSMPAELSATLDDAFVQSLTIPNLVGVVRESVQVYCRAFGLSAPQGETGEWASSMPVLTGERVPSTVRAHIESATPEAAILVTTETADADSLQAAVAARLKAPGRPALKLGMTIEHRFVFDRKLGLTREATRTLRATSGPDVRLDRVAIKLTELPKR
jgi:hypothetical protein